MEHTTFVCQCICAHACVINLTRMGCVCIAWDALLQGFEGVVVRIVDNHKGTPISATHIVKVELTLQAGDKLKKFQTHFKERELEELL